MDMDSWYCVGCHQSADYASAVGAALSHGVPCDLPTTVAQIDGNADQTLDYWFVRRFEADGLTTLIFEGVSAPAKVWVNGQHILSVNTMHAEYEAAAMLNGTNIIAIQCVASHNIQLPRVRQRWRQQLISDQKLRQVRNTALGSMPGWSPTVFLLGPYRPVRFANQSLTEPCIAVNKFTPEFYGDIVLCHVELTTTNIKGEITFYVDEISHKITEQDRMANDAGRLAIAIPIRNAKLWYPHSHGEPYRYRLSAIADGIEFNFGFVGLRTVSEGLDFSVNVNGIDVFCRGAVWTEVSIPKLATTRNDYRPLLELCRDAGLNMIRVPGTSLYQTDAFYEICDELGLLVWQDFMFANFDYPQTEDFQKLVTFETINFINRTNKNACIVVLCGGSEVYQQAAMLGLKKEQYEHGIFSELLPRIVVEHRSFQTIYIENSPVGGELPFQTNTGVTHYFGVPAYLRDFSDIRRSDVKFASECMAIANVPCPDTVKMIGAPAVHHPKWKAGVPRDNGVPWDFEDVRDYYLAKLFGVEPNILRRIDHERYLELSRAVPCIIVTELLSEWRSGTSSCNGALILNLQDLLPGCGWGIIDSNGWPKSTYFALKQMSQSIQVVITDEGLNGLDVHVINETDNELSCELALYSYYRGSHTATSGKIGIVVAPRSVQTCSSRVILPHFFDAAYAYKFGTPSHDVIHAVVTVDDNVLANAFSFPMGHSLPQDDIGLTAAVERVDDQWVLSVNAVKFAQFVHIDIPGFVARDDWLHVAPGGSYVTKLTGTGAAPVKPSGHVLALNSHKRVKV